MRRKLDVYLFLAGLIIVGCSQEQNSVEVEPGTPSYTIETFIKAADIGDIDLYLSVLPQEARMAAESSRQAMGDNFDNFMQSQMSHNSSQLKGAKITGETIDGDYAEVTLASADGDNVTFDLIKEDDGWKLDIGPRPR